MTVLIAELTLVRNWCLSLFFFHTISCYYSAMPSCYIEICVSLWHFFIINNLLCPFSTFPQVHLRHVLLMCTYQYRGPVHLVHWALVPPVSSLVDVEKPEKINRIYHYTPKGTRESHPSVLDLQSTTRLAESWMSQIMDTRMGFPCPFRSVVIDYFSPTPWFSINNPILTSF